MIKKGAGADELGTDEMPIDDEGGCNKHPETIHNESQEGGSKHP